MAQSPQLVAGTPLRGAALRARLPVLGVCSSDIAASSLTAVADIPGLA